MSQTILITGANSGIGRHAALYLASKGFRVLATGRRENLLASLKQEAGANSLDVFPLDITSEASIASAVAKVHELTDGRWLDVLINNAGFGIGGAVLDRTDDEVRRQYETNVFGTLAVTRAFVNPMITRGSGRILNVTSIGGRMTFPFLGVYNSTKYALESLSDAMRMELKPLGVDVVLIEPGAIESEFLGLALDDEPREGPWREAYGAKAEQEEKLSAANNDPIVTSQAFERAITAKRPKARYVAPAKDKIMLFLAAVLPESWVDAGLSKMMSLASAQRREIPMTKPQEERVPELAK